jgi:uncharacterized protein
MGRITLIGRQEEQRILQKALDSPEAEMVAVIGRRRVGKTFLVRSFFKEKIVFEMTGVRGISLEKQLENFSGRLKEASGSTLPIKQPADWFEAFRLLEDYLQPFLGDEKKVLFLDELPWMAGEKSDFVPALGYFWNSWASRKNLVVVICGSAASWMIENVINDTGGLYNRVTRRIFLEPFTLTETEAYLKNKNIQFTRYHIVQLYMAIGGIPHYLKEIEGDKSAVQNINAICFSPNGLLRDEVSSLYPALFPNATNHIAVIRALASKHSGMTRQQIAETSKVPNGGGLTKVLDELAQSSFITAYQPFGKAKKERLFRLTDEYSLFYLRFIEEGQFEGTDMNLFGQTQAYKTWSGYAFENVCLRHIREIKKALGIAGVFSRTSSFYKKGTPTEKGTQIDLVIDRNDHVINLCEIKFHHEPFTISKAYADALRSKQGIFRETTKTKKHLMLTLISTFGLNPNAYSLELIPASLTLDDLFER